VFVRLEILKYLKIEIRAVETMACIECNRDTRRDKYDRE
jgi:hypothetical protein